VPLSGHLCQASAGIIADGKHIANRAREEAQNFRDTYDSPISVKVGSSLPMRNSAMADNPTDIVHSHSPFTAFPGPH
jgi:hypothetical protein